MFFFKHSLFIFGCAGSSLLLVGLQWIQWIVASSGYSLVVVSRLLIAVASLVEHRL